MDLAAVILVEVAYGIASLVLISAGLAIIFGMMKVINLAHGEFMTLGGYITIVLMKQGFNFFLVVLLLSPVLVGLFGVLCERVIIRHLYGRLIDTMLATWGLSLLMIGALTMIFGNTTTGITAPIAGVSIGEYMINGYSLFIVLLSAAILFGIYAVLKWSRLGLIARGTMQRADMASALGYNPDRTYMATFFVGAALAGLAGAALAPLVGLVPTSGGAYIAKAFIAVIAGGPSVMAGLASSSVSLGIVNQLLTFWINPVVGEVGLLAAAVILLRIMPAGITGRFFRGRM